MDQLRFITAGSVDDGKSTLIGRLLYDTKSLFDDTLDSLKGYNERKGLSGLDLALVTDGLRSEREAGITIDVAYRYFATPKRKFIIADTPGHEQYTRNMVTGASTADLAIVLIDATLGVQTQSKRHGFLASLLGIPHVIVAVNKMDLVGWSPKVFDEIVEEYSAFCQKLTIPDLTFIPVSALAGDNIVEPSKQMPWYDGPTILHSLETVHISSDRNLIDFRFPVQTVLRPHQKFRGYAGQVASGRLSLGDEILVLPSRKKSRIESIQHSQKNVTEATAGQSIVVTLDDDIDVGRGDMLVRPGNQPVVSQELDAIVCWMDDQRPLVLGASYLVLQTTRKTRAVVDEIRYQISVDTLHRLPADRLSLNQIGRIVLRTSEPLAYDAYRDNRATGGFLLVDPTTFATVGAGMLRLPSQERKDQTQSPDILWDSAGVDLNLRVTENRHRPFVIWMTGLSGSGKSTLAGMVERQLFDQGVSVVRLDGDNLRHGLCGDLGFTEADRHENLKRAGHVARLLFGYGHVVLCTFISPFREDRKFIRELFQDGEFAEVFIHASLEVCESRDPKGLYKKARAGQVKFMTGIDSPYEEPETADLVLETATSEPMVLARQLRDFVAERIGTQP